jgi:hypothetical protein
LNKYLLLGTLLLLGVGLVLGGCGKKDNPFEPNTGVGTGTTEGDMMAVPTFAGPGLGNQMADLRPDLADIQGEIVLIFPKYLNAGTVNLTNISVDMQPTTGAIVYYPELKKVVITGTWTNSSAWHKITILPGLLSQGGKPIDGNGNGKADGTPYDDYVTYYHTGALPAQPAPDLVHPELINNFPFGGGIGWYPTLYHDFDANDIDSNLVRANSSLRDSAGVIHVLKSAGTNWNGSRFRIFFQPTAPDSPLGKNEAYVWSLNINAIQDTHNNKAVWMNYGYVANLPTVNVQFRTWTDVAGVDYTPLHYSSNAISGGEMVISFDDSLDYTTFNTTTVKVLKGVTGSYTGQIYGRLYYQPSDVSARQIRFTLENAPAGSGTYTVWLSRTLKDNYGLSLDGNGNGIGGEIGHPEWTTWGTGADDNYSFTIAP